MDGDRITGFSVSGHSGYAEAGQDIVCAAISAVVTMAEATINDICGAKAKVRVKEADARITLLPHFCVCMANVVDHSLGHDHSSTDSGTDNILSVFSITAVSADSKTTDSAIVAAVYTLLVNYKFASCHNYSAILVISTLV